MDLQRRTAASEDSGKLDGMDHFPRATSENKHEDGENREREKGSF